MKFKPGDYVQCVNTAGSVELVLDKVYQVDKCSTLPASGRPVISLIGVSGDWLDTRFITTEAPKPRQSGAGGMKYDGGKPRMALLLDGCPNALEAVAQVLTFGAQKYATHSWQTVPEGEERYKSALLRHLTAVGKGEELDSESNLHHLAHAACNALFILELELRKHK